MSEYDTEQSDAVSIPPEEQARADIYGLMSRFFHASPDSKLLAEVSQIPATPEDGADSAQDDQLARAWQRLQEVCRTSYPAVVRQEYDALFIGVGKSVVTPYLSGYAEPHSPDRYLVRLREQLGAWGLARRDAVFELEDHIAGVSDVMRWLIETGRPLPEQRAFFEDFVHPGGAPFLAAVQQAASAIFYQHVANLSASFLKLEKTAFEME